MTTSWYDTNWLYRKKVIINAMMISGNHTNFPVLYKISGIEDNSLANGTDIIFTGSGSTRLHHDLISFYGYTGNAWVQVSSLSDNHNQVFYMYWGNTTGGDQTVLDGYKPSSTWDERYVFLSHMNDGATHKEVKENSKWNTPLWKRIMGNPTGTTSFMGSAQRYKSTRIAPEVLPIVSSNSTNGLNLISSQVTVSVIVSGSLPGIAQYSAFYGFHQRPTKTTEMLATQRIGGMGTLTAGVLAYVISTQNKRSLVSVGPIRTNEWPSSNINKTGVIGLSYNSSNAYAATVGATVYPHTGAVIIYNNEIKKSMDGNRGIGNLKDFANGIVIGAGAALTAPISFSGAILDIQVLNKEMIYGWHRLRALNISSLSTNHNSVFYTIGTIENAPAGSTITSFLTISGSTTGWGWGKAKYNTTSSPRSSTANQLGWIWGTVTGDASTYIPSGNATGWNWCNENK